MRKLFSNLGADLEVELAGRDGHGLLLGLVQVHFRGHHQPLGVRDGLGVEKVLLRKIGASYVVSLQENSIFKQIKF